MWAGRGAAAGPRVRKRGRRSKTAWRRCWVVARTQRWGAGGVRHGAPDASLTFFVSWETGDSTFFTTELVRSSDEALLLVGCEAMLPRTPGRSDMLATEAVAELGPFPKSLVLNDLDPLAAKGAGTHAAVARCAASLFCSCQPGVHRLLGGGIWQMRLG